MNKKKTIILLIIGILVVTISSIGVTYSYMKNKTSGNKETEIGINNCAKITLKDNNSTINLENMYPMEEEMGLQTTPYEFTVSSTCEEYTGFNLYLTTLTDNGIEDKDIRYAVTDVDDNVLITDLLTNKEEANDLTEEEIKELEQGLENKRKNTYKVFNNNLYIKEEKTYKLHLWVDENANNDTMKQSFKIKVSIKGYNWDGTIAKYLITNKNNSLVYHNGTIKIADQVMDAEDFSYRYSGANEKVNNYICFGGDCANKPEETEKYANLYRIIGIFPTTATKDLSNKDYQIKIIKADYATEKELGGTGVGARSTKDYTEQSTYQGKITLVPRYYWNNSNESNSTNDWSHSNLNTENLNNYYLNEYLYSKDNHKWNNMIEKNTWITTGNEWSKIGLQNAKAAYINEIKNPNKGNSDAVETYPAKVGLMYVSDYMYGASREYWIKLGWDNSEINDYRAAINSNWLYMGLSEWVITRSGGVINAFGIHSEGKVYAGDNNTHVYNHAIAVRPTMYLNSLVKITSGSGTSDNPYIIDM